MALPTLGHAHSLSCERQLLTTWMPPSCLHPSADHRIPKEQWSPWSSAAVGVSSLLPLPLSHPLPPPSHLAYTSSRCRAESTQQVNDELMRSTSSSAVMSGRSSGSDSPPPKPEVRLLFVLFDWLLFRTFSCSMTPLLLARALRRLVYRGTLSVTRRGFWEGDAPTGWLLLPPPPPPPFREDSSLKHPKLKQSRDVSVLSLLPLSI